MLYYQEDLKKNNGNRKNRELVPVTRWDSAEVRGPISN